MPPFPYISSLAEVIIGLQYWYSAKKSENTQALSGFRTVRLYTNKFAFEMSLESCMHYAVYVDGVLFAVTTASWRSWPKWRRLTAAVTFCLWSFTATISSAKTSPSTPTNSYRASYDAGRRRLTTTVPTADLPSTSFLLRLVINNLHVFMRCKTCSIKPYRDLHCRAIA